MRNHDAKGRFVEITLELLKMSVRFGERKERKYWGAGVCRARDSSNKVTRSR